MSFDLRATRVVEKLKWNQADYLGKVSVVRWVTTAINIVDYFGKVSVVRWVTIATNVLY